MPFHFWREVPNSLKRFSNYGSPNREDNTLQAPLKGKTMENGRLLRRNYRDGGVRLVHALGRLGSVR